MDLLGVHLAALSPVRGGGHRVSSGKPKPWPYERIASTQQFMLFKASHDGESAKFAVPRVSSSVRQHAAPLDALGADQKKPSPVPPTQKSLNLHNTSFGAHARCFSRVRPHPVVSNYAFPGAMAASYLNLHGSGFVQNAAAAPCEHRTPRVAPAAVLTGMFGRRRTAAAAPGNNSSTAQLTIFYAGCVNSYDNVSREKAEQIMLMAAKASQASSPAARPPLPQSELAARPMRKAATTNVLPSEIQMSVQKRARVAVANSARPSAGKARAIVKTDASCAPEEQPEPMRNHIAAMIMPRAVPQARKASLARFLEKRKERAAGAVPYSGSEISPDAMAASLTYPSTHTRLFGNKEDSWIFGEPKSMNATYGNESLSTQLKI